MRPLLLHICCGPCAIMPVIRLREAGYEPLFWFMNPNIQPLAEYLRRREAAAQCAEKLGARIIFEDEWDIAAWLERRLPENASNARCLGCIGERVAAGFRKAVSLGINAFSTSLLYSKYQPHERIADFAENQAIKSGVAFIYQDFRKDWQKGIDLSREWGLYRQPYCGCVFSEAERYAKKLARLKAV